MDPSHPVLHGVHAHEAGNGARRPQPVTAAASIRPCRNSRCAHTRQQIERKVSPCAQRFFQCKPENEKEDHVAQQVPEASVQKPRGQQSQWPLQHLGHTLQAVILRPARRKGLRFTQVEYSACQTPCLVVVIAWTDDALGQQILAELPLLPHEDVQAGVLLVPKGRFYMRSRFGLALTRLLLGLTPDIFHQLRQFQSR